MFHLEPYSDHKRYEASKCGYSARQLNSIFKALHLGRQPFDDNCMTHA